MTLALQLHYSRTPVTRVTEISNLRRPPRPGSLRSAAREVGAAFSRGINYFLTNWNTRRRTRERNNTLHGSFSIRSTRARETGGFLSARSSFNLRRQRETARNIVRRLITIQPVRLIAAETFPSPRNDHLITRRRRRCGKQCVLPRFCLLFSRKTAPFSCLDL